MTKIAFLGLGAMGRRMAGRLAAAGHEVIGWNRTPVELDGLTIAGSIEEAVSGAELVMSMVTDDGASEAVWNAALPAMAYDALAVEASTVSPGRIAALAGSGVRFIDAPVAGSRPQAEAGELVFLAGGSEADVEAFRPIADTMGKAVLHAGATGKGIALKMIVNALLAVQTAAMKELLAYAEAQGMNAGATMDLLAPVPVVSPAAAFVGKQIVSGAHDPMFTVDLLVKDLGYLLDGAADAPVMAEVRAAFQAAQSRGHGDRHITAIAT
ncbi:MAG: NAD(P)-dependent oxidoreductase [Paracoccaceae bacterium]|nr:NAD(P)-dependent oxidoreductase [Paracoccaceae bacterium]